MQNVGVTTETKETRLLGLTANEVMFILRDWAVRNKGFKDPVVDFKCVYGGSLDEVVFEEITTFPTSYEEEELFNQADDVFQGNHEDWDGDHVLDDRPALYED
jgi:hypothetical protein